MSKNIKKTEKEEGPLRKLIDITRTSVSPLQIQAARESKDFKTFIQDELDKIAEKVKL